MTPLGKHKASEYAHTQTQAIESLEEGQFGAKAPFWCYQCGPVWKPEMDGIYYVCSEGHDCYRHDWSRDAFKAVRRYTIPKHIHFEAAS